MPLLDLAPAHLVSALASATLKITAILALAALLALLLHRRSAALRHLVWTAALGSVVAVLALPAVLPAWRIIPFRAAPVEPAASGPAQFHSSAPTAAAQGSGVRHDATRPAALPTQSPGFAISGMISRQATVPRQPNWPELLTTLWLIGVLTMLMRAAWGRIALHRLARSGTPQAEPDALVRQIARRLGINRSIRLRESDDVELPLTWGIIRPQIVLPRDASEWSAECRRRVLEHEIAHIARLDAATQLVAQAASALFWFHPLVWYAVAQMRRERERACDDHVLASGAIASDYAGDLLALVTTRGNVEQYAAALGFARRSHFEGRLLALLDPTIDRRMPSPRKVMLALTGVLVLVVPLAAAQRAEARVAAPPVTPITPAIGQTAATVIARAAPSLPRTRAVVIQRPTRTQPEPLAEPQASGQDIFATCGSGPANHDSDHSDSDGATSTWTASGQIGDCLYELKAEGQITFNSAVSAIERMAAGGHFDATTNIRGDITRLIVRSSAGGELSYEFTRRGQRADLVPTGTVWLEQFLLGLDRTTAFAVDQRFPLLLQSGGALGVLAEVQQMHAGHAKSVYLQRLVDRQPLDVDALRRTAEVVGAMRGEYSAAQVVVAVADRYPLVDAPARADFLRATLALKPDHERLRALMSIVSKSTLAADETAALLRSLASGDASADHEKSRVMIAIAQTQPLDGDLRGAFAAAAETIHDARVRSRTLAALAATRGSRSGGVN
jgi:beta-lactamase regulating signal transducer with metallopeptidase domain